MGRVLKFARPNFEEQDSDHRCFFHVVDFKSAYISLITGPRGLACEVNRKWESSEVFRFDLGPLLQV